MGEVKAFAADVEDYLLGALARVQAGDLRAICVMEYGADGAVSEIELYGQVNDVAAYADIHCARS